jgi:hypothetical protein
MDINASGQSADISLPTFWTPLSENDVILLRKRNRRRRFDISIVYAVAARCSFGFPQVLVCRPERKEGSPFPTLFWLTCPYLDRKCGELESLHKIRELEELFSTRPTEVARWHKEYALLRKSISETGIDIPTGVGGIDSQGAPNAVKCLHLQAATWIGWRYHPAADWLQKEFGAAECSNGLCGNCDRPPLKPQV